MHSRGHESTHAPQLVQFSGCVSSQISSTNSKASTGHPSTHTPQPVQQSASILGKAIESSYKSFLCIIYIISLKYKIGILQILFRKFMPIGLLKNQGLVLKPNNINWFQCQPICIKTIQTGKKMNGRKIYLPKLFIDLS
jgi:hypothetical protein